MRITYYNLGIRSETSSQVAERWESEVRPRLRPDLPGGVVLSVGVNDTMPANAAMHPVERSVSNLQKIVDGVRACGWPMLIVGLLPVADPDHNRRIGRQNLAYSHWCSCHGVQYVDVFKNMLESATWMSQVALVDGHHPGPAGYAELTEDLMESWDAWILTLVGHREPLNETNSYGKAEV
jgi:lysophospholipase L1-like esterase